LSPSQAGMPEVESGPLVPVVASVEAVVADVTAVPLLVPLVVGPEFDSEAVPGVDWVAEFEAEPASLSLALPEPEPVGVSVFWAVASLALMGPPVCEPLALARPSSPPQPLSATPSTPSASPHPTLPRPIRSVIRRRR